MSAQSGCLIAALASIAGLGLVLGGEFPTTKPCGWKGRMVRDTTTKGTVREFLSLSTPFMSSPHATWVLLHEGAALAVTGNSLWS